MSSGRLSGRAERGAPASPVCGGGSNDGGLMGREGEVSSISGDSVSSIIASIILISLSRRVRRVCLTGRGWS